MKGIISLILILVLLTLAFAIGSQNEAVIAVNYLIAQSEMRVSTLIAVSVAVGVVIGLLLMLVSWLALRVQLVAARAKIRKLTKEA
ncbi:LapA family protein [Alteromonas sp. ASW11-130]|uniref:LapA family protein n=1 Tax=Alteromonas sp. ASW11-130 TaxID=3015775 RepID=UPI0022429148|nr:LapA family protein [Alteromonas sp. ASW11-130]MCW8092400.1 LapA family protein [Alteromonas sp. ASW11-130]